MRKNGNVVLIAPREELALKEKQQLEAQVQISELEPLQTEIVPAQLHRRRRTSSNLVTINRQQQFGAGAGRRRRRAAQGSILSQARHRVRRSAHQHPVRQDIRARLEEVRRIIRQIDMSVRQVLIEARIVIAERQVQPPARRALRPADRLHALQQALRGRLGGSLNTQPVVTPQRRPASHARHAHADAVRARVGHCDRRLLGFAAAQREPAGGQRRRASSR